MTEPTIEDYLHENRLFPPSAEFKANALTSDDSLYREADADYEAFWARQARELLTWNSDFTTTLEWELPFAKWFVGGSLNVSENCLDRHVANGIGDRVAYHWEGEPGDMRTITYADLLEEVQKFANVLKGLGLKKGDRVAIYMPMIPELPVAMLACTRIGVAHSVIFGGFSPDSIIDRVQDGECKVIITADGGYRRGAASLLKPNVDDAVGSCPSVTDVVVVQRTNSDVTMVEGRDHWYHDLMGSASADCPAEPMDSEQLLYLLYTSGTTAKPKGIMHTTGGYLTQVAFTYKYVFDLKPETDIYWCSADIGWVTGHSYIVYGPLVNGATSVLYEGTPDTPGKDRMWDIIERYGVTQLYTAPTAIRTFMKWGEQEPQKHDLSSLRLLGSVGESINPEAWMWYHEHIGASRCPIVDTWWQTETGGQMITPLPGVTTLKPGSACMALPGIGVEVVDEEGHTIEHGGGYLTLTRPWPSMLRGIWGDPERYKDTYWSRYPGRYFAGDGAKIDEDGYLWLLGRVDDVMNVSGHRISTTEVESALVDHTSVAEAAVVGATDDLTGQAIVGYVIVRGGVVADDALVDELRAHVAQKIGPTARPKRVIIVPDLPKTRSGKIMRRLLRDIADGHELGDTTTLADPSVVDAIRESALHGPGSGA
ncbi:MAG: acetate--CoA ligase [Actinobacteria bacterium]|uniref:acetate--CoA ligase n=1 Tax=freshwater metagenome TaxID=449393 RepID=A0A6J6YUA7_9ZZZZ|nr:acetate--CoA ligase [Actinomycetota bacterium]MSX95931.1 acetate--CoA ligase [Actinomycetota bacterium]MSY34289.1 acetate--CoA ligase [Actinomycetota bacterium]MTA43235.1 acetate--CoA ligase [Actinomycetota bacterium]